MGLSSGGGKAAACVRVCLFLFVEDLHEAIGRGSADPNPTAAHQADQVTAVGEQIEWVG
jgi:hypothetical protein